MPKILHIGGSDSPHVLGIMEQIKQNTNFEQVLLSYTNNKFDKNLLRNINIYVYDYRKFFKNPRIKYDETKLNNLIKAIINKEKPDIIHGHYLSQCAVPLYNFLKISKKPGLVMLWSLWDIYQKEKSFEFCLRKKCLDLCDYFSCTSERFAKDSCTLYKLPIEKFLFCMPPVRLSSYKNHLPDLKIPRIFIARRYHQSEICKALQRIVFMYPWAEITIFRPSEISIKLLKKLKIYNKIKFVGLQSQKDFSKLIKNNNIVVSIADDIGLGGTTLQAAYSGAVVISNKENDVFLDKENILITPIRSQLICHRLIHAIRHLKELSEKFKKNNAFLLSKFGSETTWNNLLNAYSTMLNK